jgi:hypothetical protein
LLFVFSLLVSKQQVPLWANYIRSSFNLYVYKNLCWLYFFHSRFSEKTDKCLVQNNGYKAPANGIKNDHAQELFVCCSKIKSIHQSEQNQKNSNNHQRQKKKTMTSSKFA